ncbi:hypothetical protein [Williamsia deligens]|uniref:Uncharacterized protein n=1 Tax=Williamsia deligens TaxID=321325 RepID=A0ABW3GD72_9NOCA|nr:hypothetical protein [Williamsia deligens]MCP2195631.1 hypothetical protein [Williamsia deligens]
MTRSTAEPTPVTISYPGGEPTDVFATALDCLIRETRMPSDVEFRVQEGTRARDAAQWPGWDAEWTYTESAGLRLVLRIR